VKGGEHGTQQFFREKKTIVLFKEQI